MKHILSAALPLFAVATPAFAADDIAKQITEMETKWTVASTKHDAAYIGSIVADDWTGVSPSGKIDNKAGLITRTKDTAVVTKSASNHDVKVRVMGDVAVAQGASTEISTDHGKDSSGTYVWTDVFQKRGGKWLAVASQTAKKK